ncbi:hypothetical protein SH449x_003339 [Pirellulaceae bacterium SH449]
MKTTALQLLPKCDGQLVLTALPMKNDGDMGRLDDNTFILVGRRYIGDSIRSEDRGGNESVADSSLWQFSQGRRIESQWPIGGRDVGTVPRKRPAS